MSDFSSNSSQKTEKNFSWRYENSKCCVVCVCLRDDMELNCTHSYYIRRRKKTETLFSKNRQTCGQKKPAPLESMKKADERQGKKAKRSRDIQSIPFLCRDRLAYNHTDLLFDLH